MVGGGIEEARPSETSPAVLGGAVIAEAAYAAVPGNDGGALRVVHGVGSDPAAPDLTTGLDHHHWQQAWVRGVGASVRGIRF